MRKLIVTGISRGDTIIEVLFAVTIFSFIAIGGISLMNKGTALAQRALEISLVRQQMDAQADALRYLNQAYVNNYGDETSEAVKLWKKLTGTGTDEQLGIDPSVGAKPFNTMVEDNKCITPVNKVFVLNLKKLELNHILYPSSEDPLTYAKISYDDRNPELTMAEGLWVQAVRSASGNSTGFSDFHIRACWYTPGQERPVTLGTIVRLYEPRG